jgi:hypothetical protein
MWTAEGEVLQGGVFFTKNYKLCPSSWGRTQNWRKERIEICCAFLLHGELLQIVFLTVGWHRALDKRGKDLHGEIFFMESSWRLSFCLRECTGLWRRRKGSPWWNLLHGELLKIVFLPEHAYSRSLDEGGEDLHVAVFFIENSWRLSFYLRECIGLLTKKERISMVQSSSWRTPADYLSAWWSAQYSWWKRRRSSWCSPSSRATFLKVVHLPEGGSGTVDKGGEDLHCAVLPHRELLKVM